MDQRCPTQGDQGRDMDWGDDYAEKRQNRFLPAHPSAQASPLRLRVLLLRQTCIALNSSHIIQTQQTDESIRFVPLYHREIADVIYYHLIHGIK